MSLVRSLRTSLPRYSLPLARAPVCTLRPLLRYTARPLAVARLSSTISSSPPPTWPPKNPSAPAPPLEEPYVPPVTWIDSLPKPVRPYLYLTRIEKPIGTWLLFWPCSWSIILASTDIAAPVSTPIWYTALFGTGALLMRGAGCTINDMWDRKIDKQVARTKFRPLAAGDITPFQATAFLGVQLSAALGVLTQLNMYSIVLGASSLSLVVIYPFMKRITHWPQSVLALCFNWGALLGWSAVAGHVEWAVALPLYTSGVFWTLIYDTIYAHQDKFDDVKIGVKSTAILFGKATIPILTAFTAAFSLSLAYAGHVANCSPAFFAVSVGGSTAHLFWQLKNVQLDVRSSCWRMFASNKWLGAIVATGLGIDYWWRVGGGEQLLLGGSEREESS